MRTTVLKDEILGARLTLDLYGEFVDPDDPDNLEMSYANEEAQGYLCVVTKPCFDSLQRRYKELCQGDLAKMRKNLDGLIQTHDNLIRLEKSRAEIPESEPGTLLDIEQKIEYWLNTLVEAKRVLRDSVGRVKCHLSLMRDYLREYDELLRYLEDHSEEQQYQQLFTQLEEECNGCRNHPICKLDVDQKRSNLLVHLYEARANVKVTRADAVEAMVLSGGL